mmetsp:Transcript_73258/g.145728  ORF Transcript_73258/g.145728 Transcript_73258/m.145728 type:complete len:206 (-) Transcript_73258:52-669(-)
MSSCSSIFSSRASSRSSSLANRCSASWRGAETSLSFAMRSSIERSKYSFSSIICSGVHASWLLTVHAGPRRSLANAMSVSLVKSFPSYSCIWSSPPCTNLSEGKDSTLNRLHRASPSLLVVQSTSPILILSELAYATPRASQSPAMALQCPHQGAKNLTKTLLPPNTKSSKVSDVSSVAVVLGQPMSAIVDTSSADRDILEGDAS